MSASPRLVSSIACAVWGACVLGCAGSAGNPGWSSALASVPELHIAPAADLPSPEGVAATSGELRAVPIRWDPVLVGDVGGYVIERSEHEMGPFERLAVVSGRLETVYVDTATTGALPPVSARGPEDSVEPFEADSEVVDEPVAAGGERLDGVTWYYRVRTFASDGALSPEASLAVLASTAPPPLPPQELRAYSRQPRSVPLSWRASDDPHVDGYSIQRSPTARGPYETRGTVDGRHRTVFVDRDLGDLRVFYYRVASRNAAGGVGPPGEPERAVTKPVPLPPIGLHTVERRLGENVVAWEPNVEDDVRGYRLLRIREGSEEPQVVAELPRDAVTCTDSVVGAGERLSYTLIALDRDGLESGPSKSIEVDGAGYDLTARPTAEGVHLSWNPRSNEGFRGAHLYRGGLLGESHLGFVADGSFLDTEVRQGRRYRYRVELQRLDESRAPRSLPVEVEIPESS